MPILFAFTEFQNHYYFSITEIYIYIYFFTIYNNVIIFNTCYKIIGTVFTIISNNKVPYINHKVGDVSYETDQYFLLARHAIFR